MDVRTVHCPNCSAPLTVPVGEVEVVCDFCESRLKFHLDAGELAVVKTREEMKYRERVAVRKAVLQKQLEQEEAERWRRTAAQVAIAVLPVVGSAVGRNMFHAALGRRSGCLGCGCLLASLAALAVLAAALLVL
jgi:Zn-finger nucleic acid-binding protein